MPEPTQTSSKGGDTEVLFPGPLKGFWLRPFAPFLKRREKKKIYFQGKKISKVIILVVILLYLS